ncbi:hypothetical protein [Embleya scabrispora]|nr:hypothetical protein [Embleya scabrispora]
MNGPLVGAAARAVADLRNTVHRAVPGASSVPGDAPCAGCSGRTPYE